MPYVSVWVGTRFGSQITLAGLVVGSAVFGIGRPNDRGGVVGALCATTAGFVVIVEALQPFRDEFSESRRGAFTKDEGKALGGSPELCGAGAVGGVPGLKSWFC